jgi:predicted DNA-binding transcriptional regulator YafY
MSASKTRRWLALLDLLPSSGTGFTVERILEKLEQFEMIEGRHRRTIQRDLAEMESSGLVHFENGIDPSSGQQTWRLERNAFGQTRLTPLNASILKLSLEHLRGLLPPVAFEALKASQEVAERVLRMQRVEEPGVRPWGDKLRVIPAGPPLGRPQVQDDVVREVYEALARDRRFRATYRKPGAPPSTRTYHPLALIVRPPKFQVLVHSGRDPYILNLHRIEDAECLDERIDVPADWSLDQWLELRKIDVRVGDKVRLELRTTRELADHWSDTPLGEAQEIEPAEGGAHAILRAQVLETDSLRRYLLSLGDQIEVLEPASIRDWLHQQASAIAVRHQGARAGEVQPIAQESAQH